MRKAQQATAASGLSFSPVKSASKDEHAMRLQFKKTSEVGHVPFGSAHRGPRDDARDRSDTLAKTSFAWKMPTTMK